MKLSINELIIGLFIYFIAIYIHEFGHYIVAKFYNKFIKVNIDLVPSISYYTDDIEEERQILGYGIIFGYIIIFAYSIYLRSTYGYQGVILAIIFMINYINGCMSDIERLCEL